MAISDVFPLEAPAPTSRSRLQSRAPEACNAPTYQILAKSGNAW